MLDESFADRRREAVVAKIIEIIREFEAGGEDDPQLPADAILDIPEIRCALQGLWGGIAEAHRSFFG